MSAQTYSATSPTPSSLPTSTRPALPTRNESSSLPPSDAKRTRLELDWSSYEQATPADEELWRRRRLERAASRQSQSQLGGSSGSSISQSSSHVSVPPTKPQVIPQNARPMSPPIECVYPPARPIPPSDPAPQPNVVAQDVEMDDDDDAFLRRLMAQADQMRQVEEKLGQQLDACTLSPPHPTNQGVVPTPNNQGPIDVMADTRDEKRQKAITYLESIFLGFLDDLVISTEALNEREISRKKGKKSKRKLDDEGNQEQSSQESEKKVGVEMKLKNRSTGGDQVVSFPDDPVHPPKTPALVKMARQMRVAQLLYEAVLTGCVTTKRDIYYKDVQLFQNQSVVDKLVDDIVATAGLQRQDFMVCATAKGLVASSALQIHMRSGQQLALSASNASLIPAIERIKFLQAEGGLSWVLIVEKDAVFQSLLSLGLLGHPAVGKGVLITGKGYPDLATLQLCNLIRQTLPSVTFHALVDADPHGIDIMQVYAHGSRSTKHSHDHVGLALGDKLRWMGVKASQWSTCGVKYDELLHLTDDDVTKAMAMLKRRDLPYECKRELQNMLHLNRKAEIQILSSTESTDTIHESLFGESTQPSVVGLDTNRQGMRGGLLEYVVAGLTGRLTA